jgi:hypothetical protein
MKSLLKNAERTTRRFGVMAAVARRKRSANLEVCRPPEVQWKPPLRQAAVTLCDTRERQCVLEKNPNEREISAEICLSLRLEKEFRK